MKHEKNFVARDIDTGVIIANRVNVASTRAKRAIGLLGRNHLESGEALWITPCHGVHTWFMRFSIDLAFLDRELRVLRIVPDVRPWRFAYARRSRYVLELPAGAAARRGLQTGDRLVIS